MKTLVHDPEKLRVSAIMRDVQQAQIKEEFPLKVSIGKDSVTILTPEEAHMFQLGMLLCHEGRRRESKRLRKRFGIRRSGRSWKQTSLP